MNGKIDIKISGSGMIGGGEYGAVRISGSGTLKDTVRCEELRVSGSARSDGEIACTGEVAISGSAHTEKDLSGEGIAVSGSLRASSVAAQKELRVSGSVRAQEKIRAGSVKFSGSLSCRELEAERVEGSGVIRCEGLLNAEDVDLAFRSRCTVGSIGGGTVRIRPHKNRETAVRLPLLSSLFGGADEFEVTEAIEADTAALEGVKAERVTCRIAAIGAGCTIDLLQYSETAEISPDATVKKCEKV